MFKWITSLDNSVEQYINSINTPALNGFFYYVTEFGGLIFVALVCFFLTWFLWSKKPALLKYFIPAILINEFFVYFLKNAVGRLRPFGALKYEEFDGSMPSGHSAISIFLYGYISYLLIRFYPKSWRRNLIILFLSVLVILTGLSRLFLNVHYLSDILTGYLLGGTTLFYLIKFSNKNR